MGLARLKVPAIITSSTICFMLGVGAGVGAMTFFGYTWDTPRILGGRGNMPQGDQPVRPNPFGGGGGGGPGMAGGGPGMAGGGPGGMRGGGGGPMGGGMRGGGPMGGAQQPSSKTQLASLVVKLDQLANNTLTLRLTEDQRKKIRTQLAGLETKEDLSEEEAREKLTALLDIVKDQQSTLEAAGYRAGGGPGRGANADTPNPFKDDNNGKHLKSLQETLAKGPPA